jgi:hypothetical protein
MKKKEKCTLIKQYQEGNELENIRDPFLDNPLDEVSISPSPSSFLLEDEVFKIL